MTLVLRKSSAVSLVPELEKFEDYFGAPRGPLHLQYFCHISKSCMYCSGLKGANQL
jgi:hypothetical protein